MTKKKKEVEPTTPIEEIKKVESIEELKEVVEKIEEPKKDEPTPVIKNDNSASFLIIAIAVIILIGILTKNDNE